MVEVVLETQTFSLNCSVWQTQILNWIYSTVLKPKSPKFSDFCILVNQLLRFNCKLHTFEVQAPQSEPWKKDTNLSDQLVINSNMSENLLPNQDRRVGPDPAQQAPATHRSSTISESNAKLFVLNEISSLYNIFMKKLPNGRVCFKHRFFR